MCETDNKLVVGILSREPTSDNVALGPGPGPGTDAPRWRFASQPPLHHHHSSSIFTLPHAHHTPDLYDLYCLDTRNPRPTTTDDRTAVPHPLPGHLTLFARLASRLSIPSLRISQGLYRS
jgi:hypothetical protein